MLELRNVEEYGYDPGAALVGVSVGGAPAFVLTYDRVGRTTTIAGAAGDRAFRYDVDGNLLAIRLGGTPLASYGFDGQGRRDTVAHLGTTRRYVVAPGIDTGLDTTHAVLDSSGALLAHYLYAGEHAVMRIEPTRTVYYLRDVMGSVIALADETGSRTAAFDYHAFGGVRVATGSDAALPVDTLGDFRFQGMWLDPTGFYFVRARTYHTQTGRFLTRDPATGIQFRPETYAPYRFANANPFAWRDPTGAWSLTETQQVVAGIGFVAGVAVSSYLNAELFLNQQYGKFALHVGLSGIMGAVATMGATVWAAIALGATTAGIETAFSSIIDCGRVSARQVVFSMGAGAFLGGLFGGASHKYLLKVLDFVSAYIPKFKYWITRFTAKQVEATLRAGEQYLGGGTPPVIAAGITAEWGADGPCIGSDP